MKKQNEKSIFYSLFVILVIGLMVFTGCEPVQPVEKPVDPKDPGITENPIDIAEVKLTADKYFEYKFDPEGEIETFAFKSEEELKAFIEKFQYNDYGYGYRGGFLEEAMDFAPMADIATGAVMEKSVSMNSVETDGGNDYSGTNNQVATVDEADMLKTDGEYIYTITNNVLYIVKAFPEDNSELVSSIELDDLNPTALFVSGDKLALFGSFYNNDYFKEIDISPRNGMSFFNVYDISDREDPELVKEYKFEGRYFNGRMMGDYVYILTQTGMHDRAVPMPVIFEDGVQRSMPVEDVFYFPVDYDSPEFVNIHAINIADLEKDIESKSVAVEGGQNLYVSEENIFITYTEYLNEYDMRMSITMEKAEGFLTDKDKKLINKIEDVDNDILSKREKKSKIQNIYMTYINNMKNVDREKFYDDVEEILKEQLEQIKYMEYTVVHRIEIDEDRITPEANGKVPGRILNQFSLDEKHNILRIATTLSARWNRYGGERTQSENNVYTLDEDLDIIGSLEGLAESERIYSTRFIDDRLYMVTFRQVDPFFVIDLSNPEDIKELGQLKIPGFSRYLHPYDKDTIIGIGQEATETGRTTGLKISLFDVSDVENPKEVSKFVTEERYASSTALYEHKAFLFSKDKNLLVIPAYSSEGRNWNGNSYEKGESYNGAFVFDITKDDIELRGLIDHSMANSNYNYGASVERSLYIEDMLYTKSPNLVRINALNDLHSVNNITLEVKPKGIKVY